MTFHKEDAGQFALVHVPRWFCSLQAKRPAVVARSSLASFGWERCHVPCQTGCQLCSAIANRPTTYPASSA